MCRPKAPLWLARSGRRADRPPATRAGGGRGFGRGPPALTDEASCGRRTRENKNRASTDGVGSVSGGPAGEGEGRHGETPKRGERGGRGCGWRATELGEDRWGSVGEGADERPLTPCFREVRTPCRRAPLGDDPWFDGLSRGEASVAGIT